MTIFFNKKIYLKDYFSKPIILGLTLATSLTVAEHASAEYKGSYLKSWYQWGWPLRESNQSFKTIMEAVTWTRNEAKKKHSMYYGSAISKADNLTFIKLEYYSHNGQLKPIWYFTQQLPGIKKPTIEIEQEQYLRYCSNNSYRPARYQNFKLAGTQGHVVMDRIVDGKSIVLPDNIGGLIATANLMGCSENDKRWNITSFPVFTVREVGDLDMNKSLGQSCNNVSNPINAATGNKYQTTSLTIPNSSLDITLNYNSLSLSTGLFGSSQSSLLDLRLQTPKSDAEVIIAHLADGKMVQLRKIADESQVWMDDNPAQYKLTVNEDKWSLQDLTQSKVYLFNNDGTLNRIEQYGQQLIQLAYDDGILTNITDQLGHSLAVETSDLKITKLGSEENAVTFKYDENNNLIEVSHPAYTYTYRYENSSYPSLLTTVLKNELLIGKWSYDEHGRAISSEHAEGFEKTTLEFHDNNSTTVTNPLGKKTTYDFQVFNGVHKVVKVEGHQSENCAAANKEYTYYDSGLLKSKTDWKGNTTEFKYNDQGLAIETTEAVGTPQARTVTTEWDVDKRLPLKTSDGQVETSYQYDEQDALVKKRQQLAP
ncbi:DUF6531 domain-containing protein [Zooshikella ganghwensis]|uniref:DUF6531 domain-containing protein n=1 Tax=Zooshikella ganghwensis TaxID=202772 RepID=UPI000417D229|nr:DUF6531 domain-containing protein [Zooshikella ganghwensis]